MKQLLLLITVVFSTFATNSALLENERNTIDVYRNSSDAVVFIRSSAHLYNYSSLNYLDIPIGAGSGLVWDTDGHIVTNYHVISKGDSITVDFSKDISFKATVVGSDSTKDLAVLKIDAPDSLLKTLPLGSDDDLIVGRKVQAIGNPFGLDKTLTVGVISALERQIRVTEHRTIRNVIQTDADINPGNSGGPLIDSQGRLIGVNMAIYSTSGSSAGIGFAIPINTVKRVVPQIIEFGFVKKAGLGITTLADGNSLLGDEDGVAILKIAEGSYAETTGLRGVILNESAGHTLGDVIIKLNGEIIDDNDDLSFQMEQCNANQEVIITVMRDGIEKEIPYTLLTIE